MDSELKTSPQKKILKTILVLFLFIAMVGLASSLASWGGGGGSPS